MEPEVKSSFVRFRKRVLAAWRERSLGRGATAKARGIIPRREDWREFAELLQREGVKELYHFTDEENLPSIRRHGGLYSWEYCERNGIPLPKPGGNQLSRILDRDANLADFVRLSFVRNTPMLYVAKNDGRIPRPRILTISLDVVYFDSTQFADRNAASSAVNVGGTLSDLERIDFALFRRAAWRGDAEKQRWQAEVLVKTHIPIEFIKGHD